MDLSEFVNTALLQIVEGVRDAQDRIAALGGAVSPATIGAPNREAPGYFGTTLGLRHILLVDFDVAVSAFEEVGKDAGGKLQVAGVFAIGGQAKSSSTNTATNRLSFKIPLALPVDAQSAEQVAAAQRRNDASVDARKR